MTETPLQAYSPPSNKMHLRWWDDIKSFLPDTLTCHGCGRQDGGAYVQPVHPYWAQRIPGWTVDDHHIAYVPAPDGQSRMVAASCGDCISKQNLAIAAERKAILAALPRCEVTGCKARGTINVGWVKVLLCGRHYKNTRRGHNTVMAGAGGMGMFLPPPNYTREEILRMAGGAS